RLYQKVVRRASASGGMSGGSGGGRAGGSKAAAGEGRAGGSHSRLRDLSAELRALEAQLREGGGKDRIARQHKQKKLTARERIEGLCDLHARFLEIGLLVAHDQYEGQAPAAGVVTGVGIVHDREVVVVANDATVKAGSW